jgi:hypothetical protein
VAGTPGELADNGALDDLFPSDQLWFDRAQRLYTLRDSAL